MSTMSLQWRRPIMSMLLLACMSTVCVAQTLDLTANATSLFGTWSSGSGAVITGPDFADPLNSDRTFSPPATTGIAISFTNDGYFEQAQYRFNANGSDPHCSTAVLIWQHGTYQLHNNGSLTLDPSPFQSDGRVQVQDPCGPQTEVLTYYSQFELYNGWTIQVDLHHETYVMQLYRFDGSLYPRLYLTMRPPAMLPTTYLTAIYNGTESITDATK
ncbi:Reversal of tor2 lethality [Microbotryomycetes sp. JL221]|nr:Reversal of tor2 lethality [Microbotryomycetes sp. JL221]